MTDYAPMEARLVAELPAGDGWQYEPKWDGFRCLAYRDGDDVRLQSKSGKPLARYFPEVVAFLRALKTPRFILDGELVISQDGVLSFDALQARLHPAESRVRKLSAETPALFMAFDCLAEGDDMAQAPLAMRRATLEALIAREASPSLLLSPQSRELQQAAQWLAETGGALDGVVAKRVDEPYRAGERAMLKVKRIRTADCVVAGFRNATGRPKIGSLLLGLYNDEGLLDHVGFTSAIKGKDQDALAARLAPHIEGSGFTGKAPGAPSRWSTERSTEWTPLEPALVVEVTFDQVTAGRFRHGTSILRWRPDKVPTQCTADQLHYALRPADLDL
ncbi:MAG TPA: ATP-dependent DNA ligase [Sphingomonadaceae bacterium]|nr:ATP-dependent DNA ligase [Sphingomonadaceae bacterium]